MASNLLNHRRNEDDSKFPVSRRNTSILSNITNLEPVLVVFQSRRAVFFIMYDVPYPSRISIYKRDKEPFILGYIANARMHAAHWRKERIPSTIPHFSYFPSL